MPNQQRPLLRLKGTEIVPPQEDRLVEVGVLDALLPCRRFDISYKVAVLESVSPTLEFLLRLVKAIPGIEEDNAAEFFGYNRTEMAYVLREATGPGYIERKDGQLRLLAAGEQLFTAHGQEPLIYAVESRKRSHGFDLISVAPQQWTNLDNLEWALPELPIPEAAAAGKVSQKLRDQFGRFFHELSDRSDREQAQRRGLYSIDAITPRDRFQVPVRVRAFVQASTPHMIEKIDLSSWRPEHEMTDRAAIEHAASLLFDHVRTSSNALQADDAYQALVDLAPDFLKEFVVRDGLSVRRYWREAVGRAGEPRKDRKTIALVGALSVESNIARLASVLDYGLSQRGVAPKHMISVAPQIAFWGGTSLVRDLINLVRKKVPHGEDDGQEIKAICLAAGKPEKYVERSFDELGKAERPQLPAAMELLLVPQTMMAAVVHAPIGSSTGYPAPVGFASFDEAVVGRAERLVLDRIDAFDLQVETHADLRGSLNQLANA